MSKLLALLLTVGFAAHAADGVPESITLAVRGQPIEVRFLSPLKLSSMYSSKDVSGFCRRKFGEGWANAPTVFAKAAGGATTDIGTYYGNEAMLTAIDGLLAANLTGTTAHTVYLFQATVTVSSGTYAYGWHFARQTDPPYLAELYVALSASSFGGQTDAYCARPSTAP